MWMDSLEDAFARCTVRTGYSKLFKHFCCFVTDDMRAEKLAVSGIKDKLHKSFSMADSPGFADSCKWKFTDLDLHSLFFGCAFCQADARNLRLAICTAGNIVVIDGMRLAVGDMLGCDKAFG